MLKVPVKGVGWRILIISYREEENLVKSTQRGASYYGIFSKYH
jgi:hypothetical protein